MRTTRAFWQPPSPAHIFTISAAPAGCIFVVGQTADAIYVNVPADESMLSNPTKDLLDRITDLTSRYSTAWLANSTPPSANAFQNAREFVSMLPLTSIPKPVIHVAADGEVNFHWTGPDYEIDLGFYGNGKFSYYGAKAGNQPLFGDDVEVKKGAPKELLDIASSF